MTDGPLTGHVAIVTGGSGTIGRAICRRLASSGARVTVHYRQAEKAAHDLAAELTRDGCAAQAAYADLATPEGAAELIRHAAEAHGAASILVNNAAIQPVARFAEIGAHAMSEMLATNVAGPFRLLQLFAREAEASDIENASAVNIASIEGTRPALSHSHYSMSKAALIMATRAAALELGAKGIRVNAVSPGLIDRDGLASDWPDGVARWTRAAPLERLGTPDDVANAVAFLVSPEAGWITGHDLVVDGGVSVLPGW